MSLIVGKEKMCCRCKESDCHGEGMRGSGSDFETDTRLIRRKRSIYICALQRLVITGEVKIVAGPQNLVSENKKYTQL